MKMRNMVAAMTAVAFSAISCVAMSASAAVTEIPYTGPSAGALATENNGTDLRLNLINNWGNSVNDIPGAFEVSDNITVTFTVSGIGTNSTNTNEDGSAGAAYYAALCGTIGTTICWGDANSNVELNKVPITGDGQYTVSMNLADASASIECLLISSNINLYNYGTSVEDCGVVFTLNSITTGTEDAPTEAPTEAPTTEAPAETTAAPATTTAAGTAAAGSTTAAATTTAATTSSTTTNANTGDNGIAIALAALGTAGAVAIVSRKRK